MQHPAEIRQAFEDCHRQVRQTHPGRGTDQAQDDAFGQEQADYPSPRPSRRLEEIADELDAIICAIRSTVFAFEVRPTGTWGGLGQSGLGPGDERFGSNNVNGEQVRRRASFAWEATSVSYHHIRDPDQLHALLDAVLVVESDLDLDGVLHRIVEAACTLTDARYGALGVLNVSGTTVARFDRFVHVGMDDISVTRIGRPPEGAGVLGRLIVDPQPLRLTEVSAHPDSVGFPPGHPPMRFFLGVPLMVRGEVYGNLYLGERRDGEPFTDIDEALVVALASAASIAVENARLHSQVRELELAADRERIARDLHDNVIQRLFGVGLMLQAVLPITDVVDVRDRISEAVADLDDTIRQVRTTIFALATTPSSAVGLRARVLEMCAQATRSLGFDPDVRFAGPIDRLVPDEIGVELLATLREALANVARHAQASALRITVSVGVDVHLEVHDNGIGPKCERAQRAGGRGLTNMAQRAEALGGSLTFAADPHGGALLSWQVPLVPRPAS